ncbi:MAG: hypothetical protein ACTSU9_17960, partial [Promethearchaeota archaeon]
DANDINSLTRKKLVDDYGISPYIAGAIDAQKPLKSTEDALKLDIPASHTRELLHFYHVCRIPDAFSRVNLRDVNSVQSGGCTCGSLRDGDGAPWVFINLPQVNLAASRLVPDPRDSKKLALDPTSLHFFGRHYMNLPASIQKSEELLRILHSDVGKHASAIYLNPPRDVFEEEVSEGIMELSRVLRFLQALTLPRFNAQADPFPDGGSGADVVFSEPAVPESSSMKRRARLDIETDDGADCIPNGCTGAPNSINGVDITDCCNRHDMGYCKGGTEADREKVDANLKLCIEKKVGGWLGRTVALIYYTFVRRLGPRHFNYHSEPSRPEVKPLPPIKSNDVVVSFELESIEYRGANIGDDITIDFGVAISRGKDIVAKRLIKFEYQKSKFKHGTIKEIKDVVLSSIIPDSKNSEFTFTLRARVREHDFIRDDYNSRAQAFRGFHASTQVNGCLDVWVNERFRGNAIFKFSWKATIRHVE